MQYTQQHEQRQQQRRAIRCAHTCRAAEWLHQTTPGEQNEMRVSGSVSYALLFLSQKVRYMHNLLSYYTTEL